MTTVRIRFEKTGEASYISLLDLQRVMHRCLKRSGVPVWYSQGFNPHIYLTFACPLPLGQESLVECVDCKTEAEAPDFAAWKSAISAAMPHGIRVVSVYEAREKPSRIASASWELRCAAPAAFLEASARYDALETAPVIKKTKRGEKTVDLKALIPRLPAVREGTEAAVSLTLPAGDTENVNPAMLLDFLEERFGVPAVATRVVRTGLFLETGEDFA